MKRYKSTWLRSGAVLAVILMLGACSSGEPQPPASQNQVKPQQQPPEKPADAPAESPSAPAQKPQSPAKNKEIEVEIEGMKEEKQGTLFNSEQGYYLYTLPRFAASAEEPGRDIIMADYDDRHMMRIQLLPQDADINKEVEQAKKELGTLGAVNEKTDAVDPFFQKAKAYLFASDAQYTREIIIQKVDGKWFRFTLNIAKTESAEGVVPSFRAMIKTIRIG
ncbi:hypothetical protein [Aneurinibacillus sp. REN35]|uniref:hypothetical protein n=1 Tax=Aneurinibacillus sp. REN35 TaxID=3237286 RepID=UPI0035281C24